MPDIRSSLDIVRHMTSKKVCDSKNKPTLSKMLTAGIYFQNSPDLIDAHFLLSDQVYVQAKIPPTDRVCLWLGVCFTSTSKFTAIC